MRPERAKGFARARRAHVPNEIWYPATSLLFILGELEVLRRSGSAPSCACATGTLVLAAKKVTVVRIQWLKSRTTVWSSLPADNQDLKTYCRLSRTTRQQRRSSRPCSYPPSNPIPPL